MLIHVNFSGLKSLGEIFLLEHLQDPLNKLCNIIQIFPNTTELDSKNLHMGCQYTKPDQTSFCSTRKHVLDVPGASEGGLS